MVEPYYSSGGGFISDIFSISQDNKCEKEPIKRQWLFCKTLCQWASGQWNSCKTYGVVKTATYDNSTKICGFSESHMNTNRVCVERIMVCAYFSSFRSDSLVWKPRNLNVETIKLSCTIMPYLTSISSQQFSVWGFCVSACYASVNKISTII